MRIIVLDGYTENPGDLSWDALAQLGELTVYDRTEKTVEAIVSRIGDAELVYTNKTPIGEEVFSRCSKLRFVGVLATGYNVVDVKAAKAHGITVCNVPSYGTNAVAQATFSMLLELCSHTSDHSRAVHDGRWASCIDFCFWDYPIVELAGKTMGILGFGRIGQAVAKVANAFGMKVLAAGSRPTEAGKALAEYVTMEELWEKSDILSLHCPLFPETQKIIREETIAQMKDGVILLNTGRGQLIDEPALAAALHSGKVAAAGLDVLSQEPPQADNPLLTAPNCIITPHIAWAAKESRQRLMDTAVENLRQYLNGTPQNVVS